jgi:hypothetical protein
MVRPLGLDAVLFPVHYSSFKPCTSQRPSCAKCMLPNKKEKQICGGVSVVSFVQKSKSSIRKGLDLFASTLYENDVEPKQKIKNKNAPKQKFYLYRQEYSLRCLFSRSEGEVAGANICPAPNAVSSAIMHNQLKRDINHSPPKNFPVSAAPKRYTYLKSHQPRT